MFIKHRAVKHQVMVECDLPSRPWEIVGADVSVLDSELFLVIIDYQ